MRKGTTKHDVFNIKMLKPFYERLNDYGRDVPSDDKFLNNLHLITQFANMTMVDGRPMVETLLKIDEKWDTRMFSLIEIYEDTHESVDYLKRSRNQRIQRQGIADSKSSL